MQTLPLAMVVAHVTHQLAEHLCNLVPDIAPSLDDRHRFRRAGGRVAYMSCTR